MNFNVVYEHLAAMDNEILKTIDKRRKRIPKELDHEDLIILKEDP